MLKIIGDYRYSGAIIDGQKFSFVRNGDELVRVSEVFDTREARRIWTAPDRMTLEVLGLLRHEQRSHS